MATLSIGTFNLNNLFDRWNFQGALRALDDGPRDVSATYVFDDPDHRRLQVDSRGALMTAKDPLDSGRVAERLLAADVDVWILQEVEHIDALREFNREHLRSTYAHAMVIDGNDPRFIDVGVLSRRPLGGVTSWQRAVHPSDPDRLVFSRDLVEVEVLDDRGNRLVTVFGTHLKSKYVDWRDPDPDAAKAEADARRQRQAETAARIITGRTRPNSRYLLCGDMNDTPESPPLAAFPELGLVNALEDPTEVGAITTIDPPADDAWTSTHKESGKPRTFELIDQIWLGPGLSTRLEGSFIGRRTKLHDGSDHDPAWVRLQL